MNFGDKIDKIGYPFEVIVLLPEKIMLNSQNVYHWNQSNPLSGSFSSELQPQPAYTQEKISTVIEVDIKKMDLNLLSIFTGKTELTATARLKETENTFVGKIPTEMSIPSKINLSYLNSDAYRICVEEGVFTKEQIDMYLTNKNTLFQQHLLQVLHSSAIKGVINRAIFDDSLQWDGDIVSMDALNPTSFSAYADHVYSMNFTISLAPPDISIPDQTYELSNFGTQNVTYRIMFPNGITITSASISNASFIRGTQSNGQEYIDVFFTGKPINFSESLICSLEPSPVFVLSIFLPCILSFILLIVLIVIVYLIHRKRRGSGGLFAKKPKKSKKKTDEETTGFEGEEYYVPPPPPSSR
jgi:hypothetical protein